MEQRLGKVALDQDESFLLAVKAELLSLRKRIRHETLQKLELLKQIKEYRVKEASNVAITVVGKKDCSTQTIDENNLDEELQARKKAIKGKNLKLTLPELDDDSYDEQVIALRVQTGGPSQV